MHDKRMMELGDALRVSSTSLVNLRRNPENMSSIALVLAVDGNIIRRLRLSHAMTQHDLAKLAGISRITVARLERGAPASPSSVRSIAQALGVQPSTVTRIEEAT
jgi:DNA-binding transcriptional regulator YiaG